MSKSNLEDQLRKEAIEKDCITGRQRLQGISINGGGNREVLLLQASRSKRRTHFREGHLVSHSLPSRRHRRHHRLALPPYHPTLPFSLFFFFFFRYPFPFSSQNNHQVLIFPSFLKNKIKFKHRRRKWSSVLLSGTSQFQSTWTCLNAIWGFNNLALSMHLMMLVIAIRG